MRDEDRSCAEQPVPAIDPTRCCGCGLCVHACPTQALGMKGGKATVADSAACKYAGVCKRICPVGAIRCPFEIVTATRPPQRESDSEKPPTKGSRDER